MIYGLLDCLELQEESLECNLDGNSARVIKLFSCAYFPDRQWRVNVSFFLQAKGRNNCQDGSCTVLDTMYGRFLSNFLFPFYTAKREEMKTVFRSTGKHTENCRNVHILGLNHRLHRDLCFYISV